LGQTALALGEVAEARCTFQELLKLAQEDGLPPRLLDALVGFAQLEILEGHEQEALALLIQVTHHSAVQRETQERAERLQAELCAKFTPEQVEQIRAASLAQPISVAISRYA
jgi:hypothetical protein